MILLDQRSLPTAGAGGEEHAIGGFETRTRDLTMEHGELMAQHEDLDILGTIAASAQGEQVDHESDKTVETGHTPILVDSGQAVQVDARKPRSTYPDVLPAPTGSEAFANVVVRHVRDTCVAVLPRFVGYRTVVRRRFIDWSPPPGLDARRRARTAADLRSHGDRPRGTGRRRVHRCCGARHAPDDRGELVITVGGVHVGVGARALTWIQRTIYQCDLRRRNTQR
jgi:hypothetical protein